MIATRRLVEVFVDVADTLVDDFDLIDFLHRLAEGTAAVSEATSVGLLLGDENRQLRFMVASGAEAEYLELFQLQNSEGPCLDCYRTGAPVSVPDLNDALDRWPRFVPAALEHRVRSMHAFPMRLRQQVIGALNVFGEDVRGLDDDEVRAIQSLADVATIGIIQERAISAAETLTTQLQGALNSRIVVEQAKGVIAQVLGIDVDAAFTVLRSHARSQHLRLTDLADDVVNRRVDVRTWAT